MSSQLERALKSPYLFTLFTFLLLKLWIWPQRWFLSGAPLLQFCLLLGDSYSTRILPTFQIWPIFATYNLLYSISATSWLLYWVFSCSSYLTICLICLFQFTFISDFTRRNLRRFLKGLQFVDDKIAFFNIPALEIDTEVDGLMVLRGITFSLSDLSFVVHGVEVGIKLSDDMELSIQSEEVKVKLFRGIEVGDCFANLKGGRYEMTFGELEGKTKDGDGDQVFVEGTELLRAASKEGDRRSLDSEEGIKMMEKFTDGSSPEDSTAKEGMKSMRKLSPDDEEASGKYEQTISFIKQTSAIYEARKYIQETTARKTKEEKSFDLEDENAIRAAICSQLHSHPSVPHPPSRSIKVTTLQNLSPPRIRHFLHRLPLLLRLLLNPLSYFHPVKISSITSTASGEWISTLLSQKLSFSTTPEISTLQTRILTFLSSANFAIQLVDITGHAAVPLLINYPISCELKFHDVMTHRSLPNKRILNQVIRLGGADARFEIPSFLLPHHEHLLPAPPTCSSRRQLRDRIQEADGRPKEVEAEYELRKAVRDETNLKISVHARLPAVFDQELLDFMAAIVKASKVVELERVESVMDEEVSGVVDFGRKVKGGVKEGLKKLVVEGAVNERWVARAVGRLCRRLEGARGEVGYSGDIPVALGVYRENGRGEGEKILP